MTGPRDLEDRLTAALRAEAACVQPAGDSLGAIRGRARAAHRRRRAAAAGAGLVAVVAVAMAVPARDDSGSRVRTGDDPPGTDAEVPGVASTRRGEAAVDQALWPDPSGELFTDPVAAARSFAQVVLGVDDPPLSDFREGEPDAGEVDVLRRGEDGRVLDSVAGSVVLRRQDGQHWYVTAAGSEDLQIDTPSPLSTVSSPLAVTGRGRGFEGTVAVELRARDALADHLGGDVATAGAGDRAAPFALEFPVEIPSGSPPPAVGMVLARTDPGHDRGVPSFAAVAVRLPGGTAPGGTAPGGPVEPAFELGGQPLWPFRNQAEADQWLATAAEGHAPWHADAEQTAVAFTTGYLGFTDLDLVTSSDIRATEAWVGVGYEAEPGVRSTAAVIHLVRYGPDPQAPWEVVGTRDSVLTLDRPAYGAEAGTTVTAGGTVTGVDESLRLQVRQPSSPAPLGEWCCQPAGGEGVGWSASVAYAGAGDPVLTLVVSTGGHVRDVEIFAVTALRP